MKIPNAERAYVDIRKLRDYCLSMDHPRGKHKARVFRLKLGLTAEDAEELKETLLTIVETHDAVATESDHYGSRYVVDFVMIRGTRAVTVRSSWIIRSDEDFPRLTSSYIL